MMTKRHRKYLMRYPKRIATERRKRREFVKRLKAGRLYVKLNFRKIIAKHLASRMPKPKVKAGAKKAGVGERIKRFFKKPAV